VPEPYYFGRRPEQPAISLDSKLKQFNLRCGWCQSTRVNIIGQFDGEAGEARIAFICLGCGRREEAKVTF